jgi:hypothetical protein
MKLLLLLLLSWRFAQAANSFFQAKITDFSGISLHARANLSSSSLLKEFS